MTILFHTHVHSLTNRVKSPTCDIVWYCLGWDDRVGKSSLVETGGLGGGFASLTLLFFTFACHWGCCVGWGDDANEGKSLAPKFVSGRHTQTPCWFNDVKTLLFSSYTYITEELDTSTFQQWENDNPKNASCACSRQYNFPIDCTSTKKGYNTLHQ